VTLGSEVNHDVTPFSWGDSRIGKVGRGLECGSTVMKLITDDAPHKWGKGESHQLSEGTVMQFVERQ
jgi:hypothetical protein